MFVICIRCHEEIQIESDLQFQHDENQPLLFEDFRCPLCGENFSEEELPEAEREGLQIS